MLANLLALALAGGAQGNAGTVDPDALMSVRDLNVSTTNIGDGYVTPTVTSLSWRILNRDDAVYQINVYLDQVSSYINNPEGNYVSRLLGRTYANANSSVEHANIAEADTDPPLFLTGSPARFVMDLDMAPGYGVVDFKVFNWIAAGGTDGGWDESRLHNVTTIEWRFRVQVVVRTTGAVVSEQVVPWSRSYGTPA